MARSLPLFVGVQVPVMKHFRCLYCMSFLPADRVRPFGPSRTFVCLDCLHDNEAVWISCTTRLFEESLKPDGVFVPITDMGRVYLTEYEYKMGLCPACAERWTLHDRNGCPDRPSWVRRVLMLVKKTFGSLGWILFVCLLAVGTAALAAAPRGVL